MRHPTLRSAQAVRWIGCILIILTACQPTTTITPTPAGFTINVSPSSSGSTLPAGSSTSFALELKGDGQQGAIPTSASWEAQSVPKGITAELVGETSPWGRRLRVTADPALAKGNYELEVVAMTDTNKYARVGVAFTVSECVQSESGRNLSSINGNLVELITAGKPAVEHGLLVPIQICGDAKHVSVKLTKTQAEDGSTMTTPPAFYMFRSEVWPAPNHISAHGLPEQYNVQVANIPQSNSAGQLEVDVTPGLYLLIFERDRYGANLTPDQRPSFVTYEVKIQ